MTLFICLVWGGGASAATQRLGFFRSLIWPVYLGEALADFAIRKGADQ